MFCRLIILLFIIGCYVQPPTIEPQDCAGVSGGMAVEDFCGICGGDGSSCTIDIDGNIYQNIQIGNQLWMAENLRVTTYKDGSPIPKGYAYSVRSGVIDTLETGAYVVYPAYTSLFSLETCVDNCADIYGNLYNWYAAVDTRGLCMDGWHVPSDDEIMELEMFLGMSAEEAKSTGFRGTDEGSRLAGNSYLWQKSLNLEQNISVFGFGTSGFNALPAGAHNYDNGDYYYMGTRGLFWSSTQSGTSNAWFRELYYSNSTLYRDIVHKHYGFSIRCLKD